MSPLAEAVYDILRRQAALPEGRITYAGLARELRNTDDAFEHITHRSQQLYAALCEVGAECGRLELPPLPALVVRADTKRPGDAYYDGKCSGIVSAGDQIAAWWRDLEAVQRTRYPARRRRR
jgi:hypothetical protein